MQNKIPRRQIIANSGGESRTKASEGPITDINTIVNRYMRSGNLTHYNPSIPRYGDFSAVEDLQSQLNAVHTAEEHFMALPAEVRARAGHDMLQFLEMLATEEGTEILIDGGLDAELNREGDEPPSETQVDEAEPASAPTTPEAQPEE